MLCKEHGATVLGVSMLYDVLILNRDNILRYSTCYARYDINYIIVIINFVCGGQ